MMDETTGSLAGKTISRLNAALNKFIVSLGGYELDITFLLDTSGSMHGEAIEQLNAAMAEIVQTAEETAKKINLRLLMRVVEFNSTARWLIGDTRHGEEHIDWQPLRAGGTTDTAGAIDLARSVMHREFLGGSKLRPVVILVTDGLSNDPQATAEATARLKAALSRPDRMIRIAIGLHAAAGDQRELINFASVGDIEYADGTTEEGVPLVFPVEDDSSLKDVLKSVAVSSIAAGIGGGCWDDDADYGDPVICAYDPDDVAYDPDDVAYDPDDAADDWELGSEE